MEDGKMPRRVRRLRPRIDIPANRPTSKKRTRPKRASVRRLRLEPLEDRRLLAITVDTLTDELDGSIIDGDISLRDALLAAAPFETINFDPALTAAGPATINLTLGELRIAKDVTIVGPGADDLIISASGNDFTPGVNNGDGSRVFNISDGSPVNRDVRISSLGLTGGDAALDGGGIRNLENLTLADVVVVGNAAGRDGGGIYSGGSLTLIDSPVTGNAAIGRGGGVFGSDAYLTIHQTDVRYNSAGTGGGIGTMGGSSYLSINESSIEGNFATSGGGLHVGGGTARITITSIADNNAAQNGGGIGSNGVSLQIIGSTIAENTAGTGGGIHSDAAALSVVSSTISGNTAFSNAGGVWVQTNAGQTISLTHTTVTNNLAQVYGSGTGGIAAGPATIVGLNHTILAGNRRANAPTDGSGILSAVFSLVGVSDGAIVANGGGNIIGTLADPVDPRLAPLDDNGGPLRTHLLRGGSPALDAGDGSLIPGLTVSLYDQRGAEYHRILNGDIVPGPRIDLGATEVAPGAIRGQKWNDLNGDGVKDPGEPGLEGWTIFIDADGNGQFDSIQDDLEPDDHAVGTNLNNVHPGATLSITNAPGSIVFASQTGFASTGTRTFGGTWADFNRLRVDFASPTDSVSLDFISDDSADHARMEAYDANNNLLDSYTTASLSTNQFETMTISRPSADIAYVIASGIEGQIGYLDNLHFGSSEPFVITDEDGNYEFPELPIGNHLIGEIQQPGWILTTAQAGGSIESILDNVTANNALISALVPTRFDFSDGATGTSINDGGNDMYDGGNLLNTDLAFSIPYTNGVITPGAGLFGPDSQYFTAKFTGLFLLTATDISISQFSITGNNGADGGGNVDATILHTEVGGQDYTIFVKRVFNAFDPSVNHIIIVPGDGAGITQNFATNTDDDFHSVNGLSSIDNLYYALVARANGEYLQDADVLNIANEFLLNIPTGPFRSVTLDSGEIVDDVDFGNRAAAGSIQGQKWNDLDGDGVFDAEEPTLPGWTIYIDANANGMLDLGATHVEPDDYAAGAVLNDVAPGAILSVAEYAGVNVVAAVAANAASTGTSVIASSVTPQWFDGHSLRIDFDAPTAFVSIDAISDDAMDRATLSAYASDDTLLATYNTASLAAGNAETMFIDRPTSDIAYVIATGLGLEAIHLDNFLFGRDERSAVTDATGSYSFDNLQPGNYLVAEVPQPGWVQTGPKSLASLLSQLNVNHGTISDLVPTRYDFLEGETGSSIINGGENMYNTGNVLNTNLGTSIPYTNGSIAHHPAFGPGSEYFTAKFPGLFVAAANNIDISSFTITGALGNSGTATVTGANLQTTVNGADYRVFLKRTWNGGTPSVNHIVIVPDGLGASHASNPNGLDDFHAINNLSSVNSIYYLLVARAGSALLANADAINIANAFLENLAAGPQLVGLNPGVDATGINFGNQQSIQPPALVGDYNQDGIVGAADYTVWRNTQGQSVAPYSGADGDGDGVVSRSDYTLWKANFGNTLGSGSTAAALAALPSSDFAPQLVLSDPAPLEPTSHLSSTTIEPAAEPTTVQWPVSLNTGSKPAESTGAALLAENSAQSDSPQEIGLFAFLNALRPNDHDKDGECELANWEEDQSATRHDSLDSVDEALAGLAAFWL
jgi:hypothetical protein